MLTKRRDPALIVSRYVVGCKAGADYIVWSTRTGQVVRLPETENLRTVHEKKWEPYIERLLTQAQILVSAAEDEFATVQRENSQYLEEDPEIDLVLVANSNCVLGCNMDSLGGYCGQTHISGSMSAETIDSVVQLIRSSVKPHHKILRISWFGGEPLLSARLIKTASPLLKRCAEELNLKYYSTLVTGGTLLSHAFAKQCVSDLGITAISVTIDGVGEVHDSRRATKSRKPTFERIIHNLERIVTDSTLDNLVISIRSNVDYRNISGATGLVNYLAEKGWQKRVHLYFTPVHSWGERKGADIPRTEVFAAAEIDWFKALDSAGFRVDLLPTRKHLVCRVVSPARVVVGVSGELHRCTESPLTPINAAADTLEPVDKWKDLGLVPRWDWTNDIDQGKFPCTECPYLPVCGGACPLSWRSGSDVPCPTFKFNAEDRLALMARGMAATAAASQAIDVSGPNSLLDIEVATLEDALGEAASPDADDAARRHAELRRVRESSETNYLERAGDLGRFRRPGSTATDHAYSAAILSTAAYLFYKGGDLDRVVECSEAAIDQLARVHALCKVDVRLAQGQILLNVLAAQLRLTSCVDTSLGVALIEYLRGERPLRISRTYMARLDPAAVNRVQTGQLRETTERVLEVAGHSETGCRK